MGGDTIPLMPKDGSSITRELTSCIYGDAERSSEAVDTSLSAVQILAETQPRSSEPGSDGRVSEEVLESTLLREVEGLLLGPGNLLGGKALYLHYSTHWLEDTRIHRHKGLWGRDEGHSRFPALSDIDEVRSLPASEPVMFEMFHHQPFIRWACIIQVPTSHWAQMMRLIRWGSNFGFSHPPGWVATESDMRQLSTVACDHLIQLERWRPLATELAKTGDILLKTGTFEIDRYFLGVHIVGDRARLQPALKRYVQAVASPHPGDA